jgi:amidase
VGADPGSLRIGMSTSHPVGGEVHPDCVAATEHTAELLSALGHRIEDDAPRFDTAAMSISMLDLWAVANAAWHDTLVEAFGRALEPDELEPTTWELVEHGSRLSATDLTRALEHLEAAAWQIAAFFEEYDLWLTPTLAQPPLALGELNRSVGSAAGWWSYDMAFNPWNPIANIAGVPAMSLPLHWSADGLPIGVLVTGRYGEEATLFRLAAQLEAARPWAGRRPPIHALAAAPSPAGG